MTGFAGGGSGGGGSVSGTAPISVSGNVVSLNYNTPFYNNGGSLDLMHDSSLQVSGGSLGGAGPSTTISLVCEVTCAAGILTVKTRTLTITGGVITNTGTCA